MLIFSFPLVPESYRTYLPTYVHSCRVGIDLFIPASTRIVPTYQLTYTVLERRYFHIKKQTADWEQLTRLHAQLLHFTLLFCRQFVCHNNNQVSKYHHLHLHLFIFIIDLNFLFNHVRRQDIKFEGGNISEIWISFNGIFQCCLCIKNFLGISIKCIANFPQNGTTMLFGQACCCEVFLC